MTTELKLAAVSMNMEEATIVEWLKRPGDSFKKGEPLYSIETEKVVQEVEAPGNGTLIEILVPEDEDVAVGDAVCVVKLES